MSPTEPLPSYTNGRRPDEVASESQDPRVVAALEEYLRSLKEARRPSRADFLARHPEIAGPLAECLDGLEFIHSAAVHFSSPDGQGAAESAPPPTRLGDYQIVRELGRGGMGVVYEAEQVSLGRRVALKVLPFAAALDPRHLQRFQLEAQAAAHLNHPHIVPIFAVGCDQGVHYYAMQLVEGRTLAVIIRDLQQLRHSKDGHRGSDDFAQADEVLSGGMSQAEVDATGPHPANGVGPARSSSEITPSPSGSSDLSSRGRTFFRSIARLGLQAAEALEHAHALGVLHRDVKPANLMVDGQGKLWITDFGLARFHDDVGLTRTGDLLGTLRYMSPEQALARRGVVDQRSDVYSLGATLYELLTLRPALDGRDRRELLHQIASEDPVAPRRLDRSIPRDLETIVLKALAKEPSARYATAQDLAEDLRRFLDDQPVRARRPTPPEQVAKWVRRHRAAVQAAVAVTVLGLAVGAALLWQEKRQTEEARQRLRQNVRESIGLADKLTMDYMSRATIDTMPSRPPLTEKEKNEVYNQALTFYKEMARLAHSEPEFRALAVHADYRVAFTHMVLGQLEPAEAMLRRVVSEYEALIAAEPRVSEHRYYLADAFGTWGFLLLRTKGPAAAEPNLRRALAARQEVVSEFPERIDTLDELAWAQLELAGLLDQANRPREAEELREQLRSLCAKLAPRLGSFPGGRHGWASSLVQYANQLLQAQRRNAVLLYQLAAEADPENAEVNNTLAWTLVAKPGAPAADRTQALALARKAVDAEPKTATFWNTLGVAQLRNVHWKDAADALETSMRLNNGGDPNDWFPLAMARWQTGDRAEARRLFDQGAAWVKQRNSQDADMLQFRSEAARLFGIAEAPPPAPEGKPSGGRGGAVSR
jgi:serine/threonine protein kinase